MGTGESFGSGPNGCNAVNDMGGLEGKTPFNSQQRLSARHGHHRGRQGCTAFYAFAKKEAIREEVGLPLRGNSLPLVSHPQTTF